MNKKGEHSEPMSHHTRVEGGNAYWKLLAT